MSDHLHREELLNLLFRLNPKTEVRQGSSREKPGSKKTVKNQSFDIAEGLKFFVKNSSRIKKALYYHFIELNPTSQI